MAGEETLFVGTHIIHHALEDEKGGKGEGGGKGGEGGGVVRGSGMFERYYFLWCRGELIYGRTSAAEA